LQPRLTAFSPDFGHKNVPFSSFLTHCRHEELLEQNGAYSEMWNQQISGNEDLADERGIEKP
jgi:hypothetical protein